MHCSVVRAADCAATISCTALARCRFPPCLLHFEAYLPSWTGTQAHGIGWLAESVQARSVQSVPLTSRCTCSIIGS